MTEYTIKFKCLDKKLVAKIKADSSHQAQEYLYNRIELIGLSFRVCGTQISVSSLSEYRPEVEEKLEELIEVVNIKPQDEISDNYGDEHLDKLKDIFKFK